MEFRETTEQAIESRLANHKSAIKRLRVQAEQVSDETRLITLKKVNDLNQIVDMAETQLKELKSSHHSTWQKAKDKADEYWETLGRELKAYDPDHEKKQ
ncbi:MAG: hypothetical protein ACI95C_000326 [Pseudohongiellaceae bacterium]|jgi:hypothetical protein